MSSLGVMLCNISMATGTVISIGRVKMLESRRTYQCDKCHHQQVVKVTGMAIKID